MQAITLSAVADACCMALPLHAGNGCDAQSGAAAAALVEVINHGPSGNWEDPGYERFGVWE